MIRVLHGDCRQRLAELPDASVQCCVTSPPYFGLRDYGTAQWDGGDPACDHMQSSVPIKTDDPGIRCSTLEGGKKITTAQASALSWRNACGKCGARRIDAQIGIEHSPDAYIAEMVAVFREVRRVLRDDGTLWLNLGDSYSAGGGGPKPGNIGGICEKVPASLPRHSEKPKDLLMMPARVALALQADGWWLRSDIIWAKPNPMPESVTDRPTSAHEHVFLLTKSARYFFDAEAVKEAAEMKPQNRFTDGRGEKDDGYAAHRQAPGMTSPTSRNIRNVWTIATAPFPDAHFATFPPELAERCIKAGSKPGDTILDPFAGAFTAPMVADRLQRHAIGIELNPTYCDMARKRITQDAGMFTELA